MTAKKKEKEPNSYSVLASLGPLGIKWLTSGGSLLEMTSFFDPLPSLLPEGNKNATTHTGTTGM